MSAVITAASTSSTEPRDCPWRHSYTCFCTCSLYLQRYKSSAHVPRSLWRGSGIQPVGIAAAAAAAAVVQVADIKKSYVHSHFISQQCPNVNVCAFRTAYSLPQWLKFYTLSLQYTKRHTVPEYHKIFQMCSFLPRTYFINEREKKHFSIYLNDDLKPKVNIGNSSGHAVWLI